jgi:hypothetical protein
MVTLGGLLLAMTLQAAPPSVPTAGQQALNPSVCAKKRVDPCGCHHVYGLRHCHPNRKSDHCEAPVKAEVPDKKDNEPISL